MRCNVAGRRARDSRRDQTRICPATRIPRDGGWAVADRGAAGADRGIFKLEPPIRKHAVGSPLGRAAQGRTVQGAAVLATMRAEKRTTRLSDAHQSGSQETARSTS